MAILTEADVEAAALDWLAGVGWQVAHGPDGAPDTPNAERGDYAQRPSLSGSTSRCYSGLLDR